MKTQNIHQFRLPILLSSIVVSFLLVVLTAWYTFSQVNALTTIQKSSNNINQNQPSLSSIQVLKTLDQVLQTPKLLTPPIPTATLIPQPTNPETSP